MRAVTALLVVLLCAGCVSTHPEHAYYATPSSPQSVLLAQTLYRAARAAGDDPTRYSFAMIRRRDVVAFNADDAIFYFSEGLASQSPAVIDALLAHEVAHELLGHAGRRAAVSIGVTAGFTILGVVVPSLSLVDLVANPLIVRAFNRDQEIAADLKAVDVLRAMGYETPRRALADALRAAAAINGPDAGGFLATEPTLADRLTALEPLEPERTAQSADR